MAYASPRPGDPSAARTPRERIVAAGVVALIHGLLGYALLSGVAGPLPIVVDEGLKLIDLLPERPAPRSRPPPPPPRADRLSKPARRAGAAAPASLRATPSPVVAPPPIILPPTVTAPPLPDLGTQDRAGASPRPGPGTGAGGTGSGRGSGVAGDGDGGGGGGETPLRWIAGRLRDADYPRAALRAGASGIVGLRFIVGTSGRVTECYVTRSSGNADLDETTCRLIKQRFRYRPTRDAAGRAIPDEVTGEHEWRLYRRPAPEEDGERDPPEQ